MKTKNSEDGQIRRIFLKYINFLVKVNRLPEIQKLPNNFHIMNIFTLRMENQLRRDYHLSSKKMILLTMTKIKQLQFLASDNFSSTKQRLKLQNITFNKARRGIDSESNDDQIVA